jgi:hypothetical protein
MTPATRLPTPKQIDVRWLRGLHELARGWVAAHAPNATAQTEAYVDLTFAFALASIGAADASEECSRRALALLTGRDEAHLLLLQMYGYRIAQARQGQRHDGLFPSEILSTLENTERLLRYVVDRLRKHSRLLEPDQRFNPYRHWGARISDFERVLAELPDLDGNEVMRRVDELWYAAPRGARGNEKRAQIVRAGLEAAPRIGEEFARRMLEQTVPAYDALPAAKEMAALMDQAAFLEKALFVAGHFQIREFTPLLLDRVRWQLVAQDVTRLQVLSTMIRESIHLLTVLQLGDELDSFLGEVSELVLKGRPVALLTGRDQQTLQALEVMLCVTEGWYGFRWDRLAEGSYFLAIRPNCAVATLRRWGKRRLRLFSPASKTCSVAWNLRGTRIPPRAISAFRNST